MADDVSSLGALNFKRLTGFDPRTLDRPKAPTFRVDDSIPADPGTRETPVQRYRRRRMK